MHFRGFTCELDWKTYPDSRPALYLVDAATRETVAVATAYLPDVPLKPGEVFIKEHSENRGMLAALENAGIVKATGETVRSGFVEVPVAKVLSPTLRRDRQDDREKARAGESRGEERPQTRWPGRATPSSRCFGKVQHPLSRSGTKTKALSGELRHCRFLRRPGDKSRVQEGKKTKGTLIEATCSLPG